MRPVELFHIGPQKAGTTWIYECLRAHPEIAAPPRDFIYYFDMHYSRGPAWYERVFGEVREGQKRFDPTFTYIRSPWAPRRIAAQNPQARIALCMRHPVERAFSHYWHEKKRRVIGYEFSAVLTNYDLFASWLEPGFYAEHIERYLDHFPREQILCQRFDDLRRDPEGFLQELLEFYQVDPGHRPAALHQVVNEASYRWDFFSLGMIKLRRGIDRVGLGGLVARSSRASRLLSGKQEYMRGVPPELRRQLQEICEPEIARLEKLLGIDLADWRREPEPRE